MIEAAFLTMGQNCTAGSRILVHEDIAAEVVARFTAAAGTLVIGDPAKPDTRTGPLISAAARDRVARAVDEAVAAGAVAHTVGLPTGLHPHGAYYPPTVVGAREVARRAGFSDERALRRAVRRWHGMAPLQLREGFSSYLNPAAPPGSGPSGS